MILKGSLIGFNIFSNIKKLPRSSVFFFVQLDLSWYFSDWQSYFIFLSNTYQGLELKYDDIIK